MGHHKVPNSDLISFSDRSEKTQTRDCNSPEPETSENIVHYPPSREDIAYDVMSHMTDACAYKNYNTCSCDPETIPAHLIPGMRRNDVLDAFQ